MIDWENLHYFSVFAEQKTLSAAARQLGVDHATVARRISSLEQSLQLKLVDRRPRTYILTADGVRIAQAAQRMMEEAFSIERLMRAGQQEISGEVSLSLPPSTAAHLIVPRLGELRSLYPKLKLRVFGETRFASLAHSEADIALRLGQPEGDDLVVRKIATMSFGMYASPAYLAVTQPEDYEMIALDVGGGLSTNDRWLRDVVRQRDPVLVVNNPDLQWGAACAGVGIAMLPDFLGKKGDLVRLFEERVWQRDIWLVVHDDLRRSPAVRAVMDFLVACFETSKNI